MHAAYPSWPSPVAKRAGAVSSWRSPWPPARCLLPFALWCLVRSSLACETFYPGICADGLREGFPAKPDLPAGRARARECARRPAVSTAGSRWCSGDAAFGAKELRGIACTAGATWPLPQQGNRAARVPGTGCAKGSLRRLIGGLQSSDETKARSWRPGWTGHPILCLAFLNMRCISRAMAGSRRPGARGVRTMSGPEEVGHGVVAPPFIDAFCLRAPFVWVHRGIRCSFEARGCLDAGSAREGHDRPAAWIPHCLGPMTPPDWARRASPPFAIPTLPHIPRRIRSHPLSFFDHRKTPSWPYWAAQFRPPDSRKPGRVPQEDFGLWPASLAGPFLVGGSGYAAYTEDYNCEVQE